jgi:hypothetical protein
VRRRRGAHPARLVVLSVAVLLAVVAGSELLAERPADVAFWFAGGAVLHDAAFVPAYLAADALLVALWRRRPGRVAWLNFVRIPLAVSGILLVVYAGEVLRLSDGTFAQKTGRSDSVYLGHWLAASGAVAAVSAAWYLARGIAVRSRSR